MSDDEEGVRKTGEVGSICWSHHVSNNSVAWRAEMRMNVSLCGLVIIAQCMNINLVLDINYYCVILLSYTDNCS